MSSVLNSSVSRDLKVSLGSFRRDWSEYRE